MGARLVAVAVVMVAACNVESPSGSGADGGSGSGTADSGLTVEDVPCVSNTRVVTASNGTRTEVATHFALVDGISPTDELIVEACDLVQVPDPMACASGSTCMSSGTPLPTGRVCSINRGATFYGNQLYVFCGHTQAIYDAQNAVIAEYEHRYTSIRIHR